MASREFYILMHRRWSKWAAANANTSSWCPNNSYLFFHKEIQQGTTWLLPRRHGALKHDVEKVYNETYSHNQTAFRVPMYLKCNVDDEDDDDDEEAKRCIILFHPQGLLFSLPFPQQQQQNHHQQQQNSNPQIHDDYMWEGRPKSKQRNFQVKSAYDPTRPPHIPISKQRQTAQIIETATLINS